MKRKEYREYFLPTNSNNNNRFLDLEDDEDKNDETFKDKKETCESIDEESHSYNNKDTIAFKVEKLNAEDIEDILTKYNELHLD